MNTDEFLSHNLLVWLLGGILRFRGVMDKGGASNIEPLIKRDSAHNIHNYKTEKNTSINKKFGLHNIKQL
jgi:hypothetical protein